MPMKDFFGFPILPINASEHGTIVDNMIVYVHWLMIPLFLGWMIYFCYTLWKFRAKNHPKANYHGVQSKVSKYVEVGVILAEVVLLFGFSIPLWGVLANTFPEDGTAIEVGIVAEQFAWNFHYPGPDGRFGERHPDMIDVQSNPLGLDRASDPAAADDVVAKVLRLPVDQHVIGHVTSKDVIHSLGIPVMRVKQDAVPGLSIPVTFKPIKTGKFLIACSQLCGVGHATMRGLVEIQEQEEYDAWMASALEAVSAAEDEEEAW